MNLKLARLFILFIWLFRGPLFSQDTFSIVAIDTLTGEVGSAGASCVDLFFVNPPLDPGFLGELFPGDGAINTQASYLRANQLNAKGQMEQKKSATEIINWLVQNDIEGNPSVRQYGVVSSTNGRIEAAAHTGINTGNVKGQIVGRNYAIQGNILSGQHILIQMEAAFQAAQGDLACKLMAALQGANEMGADSRCISNGSSSLFAYVKVAQPDDVFGSPSFSLGVRTRDGALVEPIDSLQNMFDRMRSCTSGPTQVEEVVDLLDVGFDGEDQLVRIKLPAGTKATVQLLDLQGRAMWEGEWVGEGSIPVKSWPRGIYVLEVALEKKIKRKKIWIR